MGKWNRWWRGARVCLLAAALFGTPACARTEFFEREKLMAPCMQFDADGAFVYIRNKTEAAREGGFGGYGGAFAGGCACQ